jgi:hypothetical protein
MLASKLGHLRVTKVLVDAGADKDLQDTVSTVIYRDSTDNF